MPRSSASSALPDPTPLYYPCFVFFGPKEWVSEGMKYGAAAHLCLTQQDFENLRFTFGPCHYGVRAFGYLTTSPEGT